jgi:hypothetical protein
MSTRLNGTESGFFEKVRIALTNAQEHPEINTALEEYGMGEAEIASGWDLYNNVKQVWETNQAENVETDVARSNYKNAYEAFVEEFKVHRDKTSRFFKKDPEVLIKLGVKGRFPIKYTEVFDKIKLFYVALQTDSTLQQKLSRIKITPEVVTAQLSKYEDLLAERANYDKELGESQDATKSKNAAITELIEWKDDFDATASVALYDNPQLLEVLGIFVRS